MVIRVVLLVVSKVLHLFVGGGYHLYRRPYAYAPDETPVGHSDRWVISQDSLLHG